MKLVNLSTIIARSGFTSIFVICAVGATVPQAGFAQATAPGVIAPTSAPTDKAVDFPLSDLQATYKEMDAKKLLTTRLLEGGKYNVNIRRITGAEMALMHTKTTDVWVVTEGSGTLVTGGQLVNAKGVGTDNMSGTSIRGGVERVIKAGDVVFIPAGVPHGVKETKQITWLNIRFDTKE
jgi:mannose-6-phosphate isomerase-like protein (cupin superfamily)